MHNLMLSLILVFSASSTIKAAEVVLTQTNHVFIDGSITKTSIDKAVEELANLHINRKNIETIYIVLDSPGGSILEGNRFIRFANTIPHLKTVCLYCASMAFEILQAVNAPRLVVQDNILMAHRASGGFRGQFESGELESRLQMFKKLVRQMERTAANRIGIKLSTYKAKVINEWWLYGKETVKQNVADEFVSLKCDNDLMKKKKAKQIFSIFGGSRTVQDFACPIM